VQLVFYSVTTIKPKAPGFCMYLCVRFILSHFNHTGVNIIVCICVLDSYDREFRGMYEELPPRDKARMRVADRAPNAQTIACRRLFGNLEF